MGASPPVTPFGPLEGVRVLDLADASGALCGRILADLGADVIAVEPPGGGAGRRAPPFRDHWSLAWLAASLNKRGITLDLRCQTGRDLFQRLVAAADVVVETPTNTDPGLDYQELASINPRLILATLTPYGDPTAPPASDLEITASSGSLWLAGEPGHAPVRTSVPQTPSWTGMCAAAGVLMAVLARDVSGRGQHVDVSAQAAMLWATSQAPIFWDLLGEEQHRSGAFLVGRSVTGAQFRNIWPCRDGFVTFALYGGAAGRETARALVAWMDEVAPGGAPAVLRAMDWDTFDVAVATQPEVDAIEAAIGPFFLSLTKAEFFAGVLARNMLGYPVSTMADVAQDEQLAARAFWETTEAAWGEPLRVPGSFALFAGQRPAIQRPAPGPGEHNAEIYCGELGLDEAELVALQAAGVV